MAPAQMAAFAVYMLANNFIKNGPLGEQIKPVIGEQAFAWLPVGLALLAFYIMSQFNGKQQAAANAKLIGQKAPDFDLDLKDGKKSFSEFMKGSPLPTVIDFYQNF
jgi:hypothetical protein